MADTTEAPASAPTKTEALLALCKKAKGATVKEIMEHTDQTAQVVRSRVYTLTKDGRLEPIADTNPRRYKAVKPTKAPKA